MELIHAGNASTDDDGVEARRRLFGGVRLDRLRGKHAFHSLMIWA